MQSVATQQQLLNKTAIKAVFIQEKTVDRLNSTQIQVFIPYLNGNVEVSQSLFTMYLCCSSSVSLSLKLNELLVISA